MLFEPTNIYICLTSYAKQWGGCRSEHMFAQASNLVSSPSNAKTFNNGYHAVHHARPALHWSQV